MGACSTLLGTGSFLMRIPSFTWRRAAHCAAIKQVDALPEITLILRRAPGHAEKTKGGRFMGKKKHRGKAVDKILQESQKKNPTDVLGSWTGVPWNPEEAPVQDADDL